MRLFIAVSISAAIVTGLGALATAQGGQGTASQPAARSAATGVSVILKEFKLIPSPSSAHRGKVTFTVKNKGRLPHEFVVIRTATKAGKLPVKGSEASEKGAIAEIGHIGAGKTKRLTVSFKAGHYVLICNLAGHYRAGQYADFNVR